MLFISEIKFKIENKSVSKTLLVEKGSPAPGLGTWTEDFDETVDPGKPTDGIVSDVKTSFIVRID